MQPGLSRAVPMGILGFLLGALLVIILRLLQGLTPVWAVGPGLVMASILCATLFVWGMGGFDARMNAHASEDDDAHDHEAEAEEAKPFAILSNSIWKLTSWLLVGVLIIFAIALLPFGPALTITDAPLASRTAIGYFDVTLFGQAFQVSELVVFIGFVVIMMVSLLIAAGAIGLGFFGLSRGVANAQATPYTPMTRQLVELPAGDEAPPASPVPAGLATPLFFVFAIIIFLVMYLFVMPLTVQVLTGILVIREDVVIMWSLAAALGIGASLARPRNWLQPLAIYLSLVFLLYPIFYHVAIGLVIPQPEIVRVMASLVNALLIPLVILRPKWITFAIGRAARILARFLRWVGTVK